MGVDDNSVNNFASDSAESEYCTIDRLHPRPMYDSVYHASGQFAVCTWAQDERPADLHMAQPNVSVSKTGHIPPARLFRRRSSGVAGRPHSCYDRQAGGEHLMQSEAVCRMCGSCMPCVRPVCACCGALVGGFSQRLRRTCFRYLA
jgi:hypothetical protein